MKWFKVCLEKYIDFTGRAHRTEYWMYTLMYFILAIISIILDVVMVSMGITSYNVFTAILTLGLFIPTYAVAARRLHDVNKSGWNILWVFIPLLGALYVIYLLIQPSDSSDNKYGAVPSY